MVEKCANPNCETTFRYSSSGRLFAFEIRSPSAPCKDVPRIICEKHPSHATVYFWLCEQCCLDYVLRFKVDQGVQLRPRSHPGVICETKNDEHKDSLPLAGENYERDVLPGIPL